MSFHVFRTSVETSLLFRLHIEAFWRQLFFFCSRLLPCIKILPLHGDLSWVFTKLWDFEAFMDFELAFWQKSSAGG